MPWIFTSPHCLPVPIYGQRHSGRRENGEEIQLFHCIMDQLSLHLQDTPAVSIPVVEPAPVEAVIMMQAKEQPDNEGRISELEREVRCLNTRAPNSRT